MKNTILITAICLCACCFSAFGSDVVIDTLELSKGVCISPEALIKGKISGVRVSSTDGGLNEVLNVNIRGINSLRGNNQPLYVIDGVILNNYISQNISPFLQSETYGDYNYTSPLSAMDGWNLYDIESIQILKNTSATAIYGSRGANGVVIIKTKTPSSEKFSVDWNTNLGMNVSSRKSEFLAPTFSHNHSLSIGSSNGRTRMRFSAFFRDMNGAMDNVSSTSGGLSAMLETQANAVVHFGMNISCSEGIQNSMLGTAWYGAPSAMLAVRQISMPDGKINNAQKWFESFSDDTKNFRTSDSFYLTLNFTPFFRWRNEASVDFTSNTRYVWFDTGTAFGNAFDSAAGINSSSAFLLTAKSTLEYSHSFANAFNLNLSGGVEASETKWRFDNMNGSKFFYKQIGARGFTFRESTDIPASFRNDGSVIGFFGDVALDYQKVTGLQASVRLDKDSEYDTDFVIYPAVNAYVDICRLANIDSPLISKLRLDGGWGQAGFGKFIPYDLLGNYTAGPHYLADTQTSAFFDGRNSLKTSEFQLAFNSAFFNDRVELGISYYNRETRDKLDLYQFGTAQFGGVWTKKPRTIIDSQETVIGNTGVEIELGGKVISSQNVKWTLTANVALNNNNINAIDDNDAVPFAVNTSGLTPTISQKDISVSSLYGSILDSDNKIVSVGILGNSIPKVSGGLQSVLSFKAWTLELDADFAGKFNILNMNNMLASGQSIVSSAFVEKGDFFRLNNTALKYNVPVSRLSWIKSLSLNLSATNLLVLTGYSGWCPDVNSFGTCNMLMGMDYGSNPIVRTVMIGVSAKF